MGNTAMNRKLSVVVQIDLEETYCRLQVSGCLTENNQRGLHGLIRRARALPTGVQVIVDLSAAPPATSLAVELLRRAVAEDALHYGGGTVRLVTPEAAPATPPTAPVLRARARRGTRHGLAPAPEATTADTAGIRMAG